MGTIDKDLQAVFGWANKKAQDETQPPWAFEAYENLRDALAVVIDGRACTVSMEDSQKLPEQKEPSPQQEDCTGHTNIVPLRPPIVRVRMPM